MMGDYNTRFRSVEEFLTRFIEKVDEAVSKYQALLNIE